MVTHISTPTAAANEGKMAKWRLQALMLVVVIFLAFSSNNLILVWLVIASLVFNHNFHRYAAAISFAIMFFSILTLQLIDVWLAATFQISYKLVLGVTALAVSQRLLFISGGLKFKRLTLKARHVFLLLSPTIFILVVARAGAEFPFGSFTWAMSGDSRNNAIFVLGLESNQVKLGILTMISGSLPLISVSSIGIWPVSGAITQEQLFNVISALRDTWIFIVIVVISLTTLIINQFANGKFKRPVFLFSCLAGLLPLSWTYLGRALEGGFLNSFFALALLLSSAILWKESHSKNKVLNHYFGLQMWAACLMFITWPPLTVFPIALAMVSSLGPFVRKLSKLSFRSALVGFGLVIAMLLIAIGSWPAIIGKFSIVTDILRTEGGFYPFGHGTLRAISLVTILLITLGTGSTSRKLEMVFAVVISNVTLMALVFIRSDLESPWGYYPLKFAWIMTMFLGILVVALTVEVITIRNQNFATLLASITCLAMLTRSGLAMDSANLPGAESPLKRITRGWSAPDGNVVNLLITDEDFSKGNNFFYGYADIASDRLGNFWSSLLSENPPVAVAFSYTYDPSDPKSFCDLPRSLGPINVITSSPKSAHELSNACKSSEVLPVIKKIPIFR